MSHSKKLAVVLGALALTSTSLAAFAQERGGALEERSNKKTKKGHKGDKDAGDKSCGAKSCGADKGGAKGGEKDGDKGGQKTCSADPKGGEKSCSGKM